MPTVHVSFSSVESASILLRMYHMHPKVSFGADYRCHKQVIRFFVASGRHSAFTVKQLELNLCVDACIWPMGGQRSSSIEAVAPRHRGSLVRIRLALSICNQLVQVVQLRRHRKSRLTSLTGGLALIGPMSHSPPTLVSMGRAQFLSMRVTSNQNSGETYPSMIGALTKYTFSTSFNVEIKEITGQITVNRGARRPRPTIGALLTLSPCSQFCASGAI